MQHTTKSFKRVIEVLAYTFSIVVISIFLVSLTIIILLPTESFAHQSGCHRWHTCPSDTGSYGCGDLGYDCGNSQDNSDSSTGYAQSSPPTADTDSSKDYSFQSTLLPTKSNEKEVYANSNMCGQVIRGNVILSSDITCTGDGLIVGSSGTIINLNGYSINGPGSTSSKVGIAVPHSNAVIIEGNGTIRNFQAGILITGSEGTEINKIRFEGNKIGVFMTGSIGASLHQNHFESNEIGVASHSSIGVSLRDNVMASNSLAGITLVNTDNSELNTNSIVDSKNGIFLDAQSTKNQVVYNRLQSNNIDINNADGLAISINGNKLLNNNCTISQPSGYCNALSIQKPMDTKVPTQEDDQTVLVSSNEKLPEILSFRRPGYDSIVQVPLVAVLQNGNVILTYQDKYPLKSTYLLTSYNPIMEFQFREGSKVPLIEIKQILIGKIKSYNDLSEAINSSYLFKNLAFNEKTVLLLEEDGFGYMIAEVQFANNLAGVYALAFENIPNDSNLPEYRKNIQEQSKQLGWSVRNSTSAFSDNVDGFRNVTESIVCNVTLNYGFQFCK